MGDVAVAAVAAAAVTAAVALCACDVFLFFRDRALRDRLYGHSDRIRRLEARIMAEPRKAASGAATDPQRDPLDGQGQSGDHP